MVYKNRENVSKLADGFRRPSSYNIYFSSYKTNVYVKDRKSLTV